MHRYLLIILQRTSFFFFIILYFLSNACYAVPFNIVPKSGPEWPTTIDPGTTIPAFYTVTNNTQSQRNNNFVKYLPPNVSQVTSNGTFADTCGTSFNLAKSGQPGSSCTLQLNISGPVNGTDPDPHHHLFICFPGGVTCAGTNFPLNVIQTTAPRLLSITVTPASVNIHVNNTQQFIATGTFSNGSSSNISSDVSWVSSNPSVATISSTGLATAISIGTTNITATFNGITSNTAILNVIGFAYVSNNNSNSISICTVNANGTFTNCNETFGFTGPFGIVLNRTFTFAYITNQDNSTVSRCRVSENGSLNDCITTGSGFSTPSGIALNPASIFAYIMNPSGSNAASVCGVNTSSGDLINCTTTGPTLGDPTGVTINAANTFAYLVDPVGDRVVVCTVNSSTGTLSGCAITGNNFAAPFSIALTSTNTFAYITNTSTGTVSVCPINPSTGVLSGCVTAGSGLNTPLAITLSPDNQFAYISDLVTDSIFICAINSSTGLFTTCGTAASGFNLPAGIYVN